MANQDELFARVFNAAKEVESELREFEGLEDIRIEVELKLRREGGGNE